MDSYITKVEQGHFSSQCLLVEISPTPGGGGGGGWWGYDKCSQLVAMTLVGRDMAAFLADCLAYSHISSEYNLSVVSQDEEF